MVTRKDQPATESTKQLRTTNDEGTMEIIDDDDPATTVGLQNAIDNSRTEPLRNEDR